MAAVDSLHGSSTTMAPLSIVRRRALLSQRELAKKAGVSASTIYLIENGKTRPRYRVVRELVAALDVKAEDVDEFRDVLEDGEAERQQAAAA
jgi:DNA-binding XRE family transcriptional regulator